MNAAPLVEPCGYIHAIVSINILQNFVSCSFVAFCFFFVSPIFSQIYMQPNGSAAGSIYFNVESFS